MSTRQRATGNAWLATEPWGGGGGGAVERVPVRGADGRVLGSLAPEIIIKMSGFDDSARRHRQFINKLSALKKIYI